MTRLIPRRIPRRFFLIFLCLVIFFILFKLIGSSIDDDEEWYKHPDVYYKGFVFNNF